jgi:two-component system, chemotaxis family, chemotaxis protein CheY
MTKTIMVVDDSVVLRAVVATALRSAGHDVVEACDGQEALQKLDGKPIDLIISDLNMPRLDGLALTKALRNLSAYKETPVMMLSSRPRISDRELFETRISGWIAKPFQPATLLREVSKLLRKH